MGKTATKVAIIIVVPILLFAGLMAMDVICVYNAEHIQDKNWLQKSNELCQNFVELSQLIKNVINREYYFQ